IQHEHASLALAQRCSGVPAPTPLFSALLNYRHTTVAARRRVEGGNGVRVLHADERASYPVGMVADDLGEAFNVTALVQSSIEPMRVCHYMHQALDTL